MRVLVTGAAGFVGRHLTPRLEADGWEVIGRDLEVDITDSSAVAADFASVAPDAVVHLAAQSSVASSARGQEVTYRVNFLGSRNVLEAVATRAPEARVLLIGSSEVYGVAAPGDPAFDESAPLRPRSPYARTKACADLLGRHHAERGLDVVRVRPFSHTGPGQADTFVAPSFARQAALIELGRSEPVLRVGNLDSVRDILDVEDVVDAYARLLARDVPAGVYNIASGVGRRIGELLDALLARTGAQPRIETDPARLRPTDHAVGDATRLRRATDWVPAVPFDLTLDRLVEDWRRRVRDA